MIQYFILTLIVATVGGLIGHKLKLPVGGMVGSMIAVIIFNLTTEKAVFYSELRIALQILGGAMIGSRIGREDLISMKKIIFPTILLIFCMVILNLSFGTMMYIFSDLDAATALFASTPGGVTDMAIISSDLGANPAYVAILQLCRLLIIFIFMPPIFRKIVNNRNNKLNRNKEQSVKYSSLEVSRKKDCMSDGKDLELGSIIQTDITLENSNLENFDTFGQVTNIASAGESPKTKQKLYAKRFILMLITATVGGIVVHFLGIAAGAMIGAMIASAACCMFFGRMPFPLTLRLGMQIFAGAFIGIQLDREGLAQMSALGIPLLIMVVGIFFFVFLVSFLQHKITGLDLTTCMLSSTPGGVQEMALLSEDIGGDTPKIAVMQTARLISVILFFPSMLKLILSFID
jgi:membrane AbrB-like protein